MKLVGSLLALLLLAGTAGAAPPDGKWKVEGPGELQESDGLDSCKVKERKVRPRVIRVRRESEDTEPYISSVVFHKVQKGAVSHGEIDNQSGLTALFEFKGFDVAVQLYNDGTVFYIVFRLNGDGDMVCRDVWYVSEDDVVPPPT